MNFQDIVSHILGFCLMVADFPALFKTQTTTPISQHLLNLDTPNYQLDATTTTSAAPSSTTKYTCPTPRDISLAFPSLNTCNTATTRKSWCNNATIETDYEIPANFPVTNVTRKYTLVITSDDTYAYCGDGYAAPVMLINGSYPGPLIEANWGDWLEITVINNLSNCNGTAIHWHGIRQWNTVWEDGVGGVTQCPIPPAVDPSANPPANYTNQQVFKWQATQYGSSWYHSHFSLQYADGIAGPLIIHGPASDNYDIDLGPLMITDWYHQDAFSLFYIEESRVKPHGVTLRPPSKLMNGMGEFTIPCKNGTAARPGCSKDDDDDRCVPQHQGKFKIQNIERGKTYRLRIINTSVMTHYTFWIEGHSFKVIATDFVPIKPWTTKVLNVAIGQRYDIIFTADAPLSNSDRYWIKMRNCANTCISPNNPPCANCTYEDCNQGILSYYPNNGNPDQNSGPDPGDQIKCDDIPAAEIHPIVPRTVVGIPETLNMDQYFVSLEDEKDKVFHRWSLTDKSASFKIDWKDPALILMETQPNTTNWQPRYVPIEIENNNNTHNVWHAFVIEASYGHKIKDPALTPVGGSHPIHLHGHDYVVLYQSKDQFDTSKSYDLALNNPLRRDVAMLPSRGFLILAFRVDNPGSWLMHCHIAWHASNGLALQFVESKERLKSIMTNNVFQGLQTQCDNWAWWYNRKCTYHHQVAEQDDSGV